MRAWRHWRRAFPCRGKVWEQMCAPAGCEQRAMNEQHHTRKVGRGVEMSVSCAVTDSELLIGALYKVLA